MGKEKMQVVSFTKKTFDYRIGEVTLNFTLRTDIKEELEAFTKMLAQAHQDVLIELGK